MSTRNEHRIPEQRNMEQMNKEEKAKSHKELVLKSEKIQSTTAGNVA